MTARRSRSVGERDPVIGALQRAHPGQRPVLFHSPYEAAAWSVISARRPAAQGAKVRAALSRATRPDVRAGRAHAARVPAAVGAGADPGRIPGPQRHQDRATARAGGRRGGRRPGRRPDPRARARGGLRGTAAAAGDRPVLRVADRAASVRLRRRVARPAGAARRRSRRHGTTGSTAQTTETSASPRSPTAGARFAPGARSWSGSPASAAPGSSRSQRRAPLGPLDQPRAATALGSPSSDSSAGRPPSRRCSSTRR